MPDKGHSGIKGVLGAVIAFIAPFIDILGTVSQLLAIVGGIVLLVMSYRNKLKEQRYWTLKIKDYEDKDKKD